MAIDSTEHGVALAIGVHRAALVVGHHRPLIGCIASALGRAGYSSEPAVLPPAPPSEPPDASRSKRQSDFISLLPADPDEVDVLVNECLPARNHASSPDQCQWTDLMADPLRRCFEITQACLPSMRQRGFGRVATIISIDALTGNPNCIAYSSAASALRGFTRTLALESGRDGVTANILAVGGIVAGDDEPAAPIEPPMGRHAALDEVARAVVFLCAEDAGFITGSTVTVDGGLSMTKC